MCGTTTALWRASRVPISILENIGDIGVELPPFFMRLVCWLKMAAEDKAAVPDWNKEGRNDG